MAQKENRCIARILGCLLFLMSTQCISSVALAGPPPDQGNPLVAGRDSIPNLARSPTIYTINGGLWSDGSIWNLGRVPTSADVVGVQHSVVIDGTGAVAGNLGVYPGGVLSASRIADSQLLVTTLIVFEGGYLDLGTTASPIPAGRKSFLVFRDTAINRNAPANPFYDPMQWGNGLIVLGKLTTHGATKTRTFIRAARNPNRPRDAGNSNFLLRDPQDPRAGDTEIFLENPASDWQVGDKLIVPESRQYDANAAFWQGWTDHSEQGVIAAISSDGLRITLAQPLQYDHPGARSVEGNLVFLPHVGNLTRNVVIRSQNLNGVRGHTAFIHRAEVDVRYTQFGGLGRTTVEMLDDTTLGSDGVPTHEGTNQRGRYSVHVHHLDGPVVTPANGYQFTLIGNSVTCPLDPMPFRWGITLHGSHYGLVQDNVLYNWAGWGIGTEDGSESNNVIDHNFIVKSNAPVAGAPREDGRGNTDTGFGGHNIWLRGPLNYVRNNVGADSSAYAYDLYVGGGIVKVPRFKGADPDVEGQYYNVNISGTPILEFSGNEAYASHQGAFTIWDHHPISESVIDRLTIWHAGVGLIYPHNNLTYFRPRVLGDWQLLAQGVGAGGFDFGDYLAQDVRIEEADIQGLTYGVLPTVAPGRGNFEIRGGYFRNDANIVLRGFPNTSGWDDSYRETIIRGVRFGFPTAPRLWWQGPRANISMSYDAPEWANHKVTRHERTFVYDYNGTPGDDFELFYNQQAPYVEMPYTTPTRTASPEVGLTNSENWARYGVAVGGALAPADSKSRDGIYGLLAPLSGRPPLNLPGLPPVIFGLHTRLFQISGGTFEARVIWFTDSPSDSSIQDDMRSDSARFTGAQSSAPVTAHEVRLTGLEAGKRYTFITESKNGVGTTRIWDRAETSIWVPAIAGDTTVPELEWPGISAQHVSDTAASVVWPTKESTTSVVQFGTTTAYGQSATGPAWLETRQLVRLTGLSPNTLYHYRVLSRDVAGNIFQSGDNTFTTAGAPVDTTAPTVTVTAPADGDVVSGTITIRALSVDSAGVSGTGIFLDGNRVAEGGGTVSTFGWDTRTWRDGIHQIVGFGYDDRRNTGYSQPIYITVNNSGSPLPPIITRQPRSTSASEGSSAMFSVGATGSPQLSFQWLKNGSPISGATGKSLNIAPVTTAHAGFYMVRISNAFGQIQSDEVLLTINGSGEPPVITTQPQDLVVSEGAAATISVQAVGSAAILYQWFKDGVPIPGANAGTYTISRMKPVDVGVYSVRLANAFGEARSREIRVSMTGGGVPPGITAQPQGSTVQLKKPVTFSVQADGDPTLAFQWLKDGVPIPGATEGSFTIRATAKSDMGFYGVRVSNAFGTATSENVPLRLRDKKGKLIKFPKPKLSAVKSVTVPLGGSAVFAVRATGPGIMTYQWFKNGTPIPGGVATSLRIDPVTAQDRAAYQVVVSNGIETATSKRAQLRIRNAKR